MEDGSGVCPVCSRSFRLTSAGKIRSHGPQHSRCLGSGSCPASGASHSPVVNGVGTHQGPGFGTHKQQGDPPSLSKLVSSLKVFKRIPKGSRVKAAKKLAFVLNSVVQSNDTSTGRLRPGSGIRCKFHQLTAKYLIITGLLTIFNIIFCYRLVTS